MNIALIGVIFLGISAIKSMIHAIKLIEDKKKLKQIIRILDGKSDEEFTPELSQILKEVLEGE